MKTMTEKFVEMQGRPPIKGDFMFERLELGNDKSPLRMFYYTGKEWKEVKK